MNVPRGIALLMLMTSSDNQLTTVVISYRAPRSLVESVASLLDQKPQCEIIVVNSGGGGAGALLSHAGLGGVKVVERAERLLPGAARNLGIDNARHRYIAFLADDCRAQPGWVAGRLVAHERGAACVGSAVMCNKPMHPVALASHLSLFVRRMPGIPVKDALVYGASYDRRLFEAHGRFREDLRAGEDTEFNARLPVQDKPQWLPEVRTVHRSPTTLKGFFADQFRRGGRAARVWKAMNAASASSIARSALTRLRYIFRLSGAGTEPGYRWVLALALPLAVCGVAVYAMGALLRSQNKAD